jgi:hypothetical protein
MLCFPDIQGGVRTVNIEPFVIAVTPSPKSAAVSSRAMGSNAPEKASAKATRQPAKAKVFISYSRRDMTFADQLEMSLTARAG